ncbi:MAG: metallophosphoesterase, partial [Actinomycetota bacterium]|nr:metallophosphoesterase [Actinomycetota bacterium]
MSLRLRPRTRGGRRVGAGAALLVAGVGLLVADAIAAPRERSAAKYVGTVEVVRDPARGCGPPLHPCPPDQTDRAQGVVFNDVNRDGRHQNGRENGIADVMVSNGREVVRTDKTGRYQLPSYDGMTVFVTKPAGYEVPVDEDNVPQFFYHHLPNGSPDLRFGGLPPTGPLPQAINFPLAESTRSNDFDCAIIGDTQTYSNRELGYLRDGVVADLAARDDLDQCGALLVGDVAGDDLGIYPRLKEVMSLAGIPVRAVPGNHDLDFDAKTDEHSFDTYRREIGPEYYSYDIGDVHFVGLDNVRYPCTPEADNADGKHPFCADPANHPSYNGVIGEEQLKWVANDLAQVPKDKQIVIATHIPLVSFLDQSSTKHQTDDVTRLYALLDGRPALSVSGHVQAIENMVKGDSFAGWQGTVGVQSVPFQHIVVGAASGSWWTGDLDMKGIP